MWLDTTSLAVQISPVRGRNDRRHMSPRAPRLYLTALHACGKAKKEGGDTQRATSLLSSS